jgi:hypothetical protein
MEGQRLCIGRVDPVLFVTGPPIAIAADVREVSP